MTHFVGIVVADTPEQVADLLAPYDANKEVPQYFVPTSREDLKRMEDHYNFTRGDMASYAKHMKDWCDSNMAQSGHKIGTMSTYNPDSKWDWYVIGGRWSDIRPNPLPANEVEGKFAPFNDFPAVIVDVDGWHEGKRYGWFGYSEPTRTPEVVRQYLTASGASNCFIVDFHI